MTTQKTYNFGNLTITKTRIESKAGVTKFIEVTRFNGEIYEILDTQDPDYKRALIFSINEDNTQ